MQKIITNHHQNKCVDSVSSISLEKLMELGPTEPTPHRIVKEFREKFPSKNTKDVNAYLAGFRMGLQPDAYKESREYLAQRKAQAV